MTNAIEIKCEKCGTAWVPPKIGCPKCTQSPNPDKNGNRFPPRVWLTREHVKTISEFGGDRGEGDVFCVHSPQSIIITHMDQYLSLAEHEAAMAEKDKEIEGLERDVDIMTYFKKRSEYLQSRLAVALEIADLCDKCLTGQYSELASAVRQIDEDPFENWEDGRESLKGIASRIKIAAKNAKINLAKLKEPGGVGRASDSKSNGEGSTPSPGAIGG